MKGKKQDIQRDGLLIDLFKILILTILIIALKFETLSNPYYWDEIYYVIPSATYLEGTGLFAVPQPDINHTPLMFIILATIYRIIGETPLATHSTICFFSALCVFYTYKVGELLFNKKTGLMASFLLFFTPIYFTLTGIGYLDIPLVALTMATIYYALGDEIFAFLVFGILTSIVKGNGFFVLIGIVVWDYLKAPRSWPNKKTIICLASFAVLILWTVYYSIQTSHTPFEVFMNKYDTSYEQTMFQIRGAVRFALLEDYRFITSIVILIPVLWYSDKITVKSIKKHIDYLPLLSLVVMTFTLSFNPQFCLRHTLPVLPTYYIFAAGVMDRFLKKKAWILTFCLVLLFTHQWDGTRSHINGGMLETNMEYEDVIATHKKAAEYIFKNYKNSRIIASWPQTAELTRDWTHYVNTSLSVVDIKSLVESQDDEVIFPTDDIQKSYDLIVYSPENMNEDLVRILIKETNAFSIKKFGKDGKTVEIYAINNA
ncbi:MAG: glycosyltransferase family 39 protein [Candidatus Altiarchaeota archaeon]|nr:glycosyltransferase family 39 protein [Candidatus Altiarchaeota archaeon]